MAGPPWATGGLTQKDVDEIAAEILKPKTRTLLYPKQLMGVPVIPAVTRLWYALMNAESDQVTVNRDDLQTALAPYDVSWRMSSTGMELEVKPKWR